MRLAPHRPRPGWGSAGPGRSPGGGAAARRPAPRSAGSRPATWPRWACRTPGVQFSNIKNSASMYNMNVLLSIRDIVGGLRPATWPRWACHTSGVQILNMAWFHVVLMVVRACVSVCVCVCVCDEWVPQIPAAWPHWACHIPRVQILNMAWLHALMVVCVIVSPPRGLTGHATHLDSTSKY